MSKLALDAIDIRILSALQQYGQLSKSKLAEVVNLSASPCWVRLNKLKKAGFIRGYHADIPLELLGEFSRVVVTVSLSQHRKADFERFEQHVCNVDEVTECIATGGGTDYVMKVVTSNLTQFQQLMDSMLSADLHIDRYMTYIVTRDVKHSQPNLKKLVSYNETSAAGKPSQ